MLLCACILSLYAVAQTRPTLRSFAEQGFIFGRLSDNGQWTTWYQEVEPSKSPQLINLGNYKATDLQTVEDILQHGYAVPLDISDDGNIIVGSYEGRPAFLNRTTGRWTQLSTMAGRINAVTPDGRYAVGSVNNGDTSAGDDQFAWYSEEYPRMWDLSTGSEMPVTGIPTMDPLRLAATSNAMTRFTDISPDARFIIGSLFVDYPDFAFVIDRKENSSYFVGFATSQPRRLATSTLNSQLSTLLPLPPFPLPQRRVAPVQRLFHRQWRVRRPRAPQPAYRRDHLLQ